MKRTILNLFFLLSMLNVSSSFAEPAKSGTCPTTHGHAHMQHDPGKQKPAIKQKADNECASCHGLNGISISDNVPNLAGQESLYMCGWMVGCRNRGTQCDGHEDIAGKYSDSEILQFAEYYQHLSHENH